MEQLNMLANVPPQANAQQQQLLQQQQQLLQQQLLSQQQQHQPSIIPNGFNPNLVAGIQPVLPQGVQASLQPQMQQPLANATKPVGPFIHPNVPSLPNGIPPTLTNG